MKKDCLDFASGQFSYLDDGQVKLFQLLKRILSTPPFDS